MTGNLVQEIEGSRVQALPGWSIILPRALESTWDLRTWLFCNFPWLYMFSIRPSAYPPMPTSKAGCVEEELAIKHLVHDSKAKTLDCEDEAQGNHSFLSARKLVHVHI
eukprot:1431950-Amphidinium_carterae.3